MLRRPSPRESGFTIVELVIVLAILGSVLMMVTGMLVTAERGYRQVTTDAHGHDLIRGSLERVSADIRRSAQDRIAVDTSSADWDSLTLQVPVRYSGTTTVWGDGEDVNCFLSYSVDQYGDLVRVALDQYMQPKGQQVILARGVDRLRNGEKGFSVVQNGDRYTVSLRLLMEGGAQPWTRELTTAAVVRN